MEREIERAGDRRLGLAGLDPFPYAPEPWKALTPGALGGQCHGIGITAWLAPYGVPYRSNCSVSAR